jgi:hypothetical protein
MQQALWAGWYRGDKQEENTEVQRKEKLTSLYWNMDKLHENKQSEVLTAVLLKIQVFCDVMPHPRWPLALPDPWRWRRYNPLKHRTLLPTRHGITSQEVRIFRIPLWEPHNHIITYKAKFTPLWGRQDTIPAKHLLVRKYNYQSYTWEVGHSHLDVPSQK